jgi:hypothetical protein
MSNISPTTSTNIDSEIIFLYCSKESKPEAYENVENMLRGIHKWY